MVEGFRSALKDHGIEVVEVAYGLENVVHRFLEIRPDVLVLDVRFHKDSSLNGLDVSERLLAEDSSARVVVFSQFDDDHIIEKSYKIGALAFVKKDEDIGVLVEAIKTVSSGKEYFSPAVAQQLAWSSIKAASPTRLLQEKELTAFKLIADGASISDVSRTMALSTKTVGNIVKSIKQKLNIDNYADFTKLAIKSGLTTVDLRMKS